MNKPRVDQRTLAPIDRPKIGDVDPIADHQHISNALSTAQWHLANGRISEATGRIVSAARQLKQACTDSQGRE